MTIRCCAASLCRTASARSAARMLDRASSCVPPGGNCRQLSQAEPCYTGRYRQAPNTGMCSPASLCQVTPHVCYCESECEALRFAPSPQSPCQRSAVSKHLQGQSQQSILALPVGDSRCGSCKDAAQEPRLCPWRGPVSRRTLLGQEAQADGGDPQRGLPVWAGELADAVPRCGGRPCTLRCPYQNVPSSGPNEDVSCALS